MVARVDFTAKEDELDTRLLVRAMLRVLLQAINELRGQHNLPPFTVQQAVSRIKQEMRTL